MPREKFAATEIMELFDSPLLELLDAAHVCYKKQFPRQEIQCSNLCSIKTGNCPENCGYCAQSAHFKTKITKNNLLAAEEIIAAAKHAKSIGATRFCMGAAWRKPNSRDFQFMLGLLPKIKELQLETCATLGLLTLEQAHGLANAGLDFYNHNLNTSAEYYPKVATTHSYQDRLDTIANIRQTKLKLCCGGIVGMGESREDRISLLLALANMATPPESVPINLLYPIENTPLGNTLPLDNFEFIRVIAISRLLMPRSMVRIAAGRSGMSAEMQALCFFAGANSIFIDDTLLTIENSTLAKDREMFAKLALKSTTSE